MRPGLGLSVSMCVLSACARDNPAYGVGNDAGQGTAGGGGGGGVLDGRTTASGPDPTTGGRATGGIDGTTGPNVGSVGSTASAVPGDDDTAETDAIPSTGSTGGCRTVIIDVESDTFVSNDPADCAGGSCADWTFTGTGSYGIRTSGVFDSIALLRFVPAEVVAEIASATLRLHVAAAVPDGAGLFEIHVLDTMSTWNDGATSGPQPGQPTWNEAARDTTAWTNGIGAEVGEFDALHEDWPTIPVVAGDGADGVLDIAIASEDIGALQARLSSMAPVMIGVTVFGATATEAVVVTTMDAGAFAELHVSTCG